MITDTEICAAVAASYDVTPTYTVAGDIRMVISQHDDITLVVFPGTREGSMEDWERDFDAWPVNVPEHPVLKLVHQGFATGAGAAYDKLRDVLHAEDSIVVSGHSLGAAVGVCTAALLTAGGYNVVHLPTFGCPRLSLCETIRDVLVGVPGSSYRNGRDPVPGLPTWPFHNWRTLTQIGDPSPNMNPIDDHMILAYLRVMS